MSTSTTATVTPVRERVAEELRVQLARRRMSATELARRIHVTQPYLSRRMTGEIAFDLDDLEKIAGTLGVSVRELLPRDRRATVDYHTPTLNHRSIPMPRQPMLENHHDRPADHRPPNRPSGSRRTALTRP